MIIDGGVEWPLMKSEDQKLKPVEILAADGRVVAKVVTPSGAVGFVATCIPAEALQLAIERLETRIRAMEQAGLKAGAEGCA